MRRTLNALILFAVENEKIPTDAELQDAAAEDINDESPELGANADEDAE